jgi:hypothetical protein
MNFDDTARFWGPSEKLWPELFATPGKVATKLCRDCRKVNVEGIRRYCERCAQKRKLAFTRESKRRKRGLNGRKTVNSPIAAEALTKAEMSGRYDDPPTSIPRSFSSTRQDVANGLPEADGSINTAREAHVDS